ncbi:MAG: hypothetical protein ACM31L_00095 [Actinomycetota bacterium]
MRPLALALTTLMLAAPAFAQSQAQPQPQPAGKERLLRAIPDGWQAKGTQKSPKGDTTMVFPPGQNSDKWSEMVIVQVVGDPQAAPDAYVNQVVEASRNNCEAIGPSPITEKSINGYPAAAMTVSCTKGRHSGMGGLVMVIAIRGREALYVVERLWQGPSFARNEAVPASQEMLKDWGAYTKSIYLCDIGDPGHPCSR